MIISHQYKFIFLKTNKTAGTSVEIALSRFCAPDDIITPITPEDEKVRKERGHRGPQNYQSPLRDYGFMDVAAFLLKGKRKRRFYNHITASEIKAYVGQQLWDSYFKFCIERNPWDRAVSLYYWVYPSDPRPTFAEFIESNALFELKRRGFELYTIDGHIAVNRVCRFENLSEELESVRVQLGLPEKLDLPHAKSRFRKDKHSYHKMFGDAEKARVAELFADEIKLMGYEF